jgi:hypothetical protein
MAAVATVALGLGMIQGARRSLEFRRLADYHAAKLETLALIRQHGFYPYCSLGISGIPLRYDPETASLHAQCVSYHTRLMRKHRRATWLPFLAVDRDPPPPYPVRSWFESGAVNGS